MDKHRRQPDKARQQQQQQQHLNHLQHQQSHRNQPSKTTSADHNSANKQQSTDPIQSIANVLNYHSKSVQQQKKLQQLEEQGKNRADNIPENAIIARHFQQQKQKGEASSQDSSCSPIACSHSYNQQVDQGNSYLYAYNDFITSSKALNNRDLKYSQPNHKGIVVEEKFHEENSLTELHGNVCNHNPLKVHNHNQESLIESDEDDALSYILHQHRPPLESIHDFNYLVSGRSPQQYNNIGHLHHQILPYEDNLNSFEPQGIDHHLSCSRSSHPRHICGIGGSHNDNLNHIAARLREESQRAFLLNQKPRNSNYLDNNGQKLINSNDIAAIQSRQFTNELKNIHNQLASGSIEVNHQQYNGLNLSEAVSPKTSYLNSNIDLNITSGAQENPTIDRESLLLEQRDNSKSGIIVDSESSDRSQNFSNQEASRASCSKLHRRNNSSSRGYFGWLLYSLLSVISPSTQQQSRLNYTDTNPNARRGRHKRANEPRIVSMYSTSQQVGGVGQLGGQAGAYYTNQTQQSDLMHHQSYTNHPHNAHHHYPLSSDSSLGSSTFANSALRLNTFFRSCCSKKCLFVFCLMLILLIFIFVIGLSAYLNFLINLNKTNLTPLSGRLKVDTQGDSFNDQLLNRTSKEFLAKQQQYEIILRGAFDRTQNLLKSYPNHLVKCEVYSFKQGSLWVYFRLFINKRTLLQDTQLMKRKSPDEHLDKQFLPRLTQQTLHAGFEQLIIAFNRENNPERRSRSSQTTDLRQPRAVPLESKSNLSSQRDHVKSFDDQISRLMPIIESIDLQSIQVTPEFDMLQSTGLNSALQQQSMSDNLRASQFLTTASSAVMVATGNKNHTEYDVAQTTPDTMSSSSSSSTSTTPPTTTPTRPQDVESPRTIWPDEVNVSTKKFTLFGYKENTTRPTTSSRPVISPSRPQDQQDSLFLVNRSRKPAITTSPKAMLSNESEILTSVQNQTSRSVIETQSSAPTEKVVKLKSGQPVISQNNLHRTNSLNRNSEDKLSGSNANNKSITLFAPFSKQDQPVQNNSNGPSLKIVEILPNNTKKNKVANETVVTPMVAPYQKIEFSTSPIQENTENSNVARRPVQDISIQDLWNNALNGKKNFTLKVENPDGRQSSQQQQQPNRLISVTTIGAGRNQDLSNSSNSGGSIDWHKISVLNSDISDTIRAHLNASTTMTSTTAVPLSSVASISQRPKVSPPLMQGGSLISPLRQQEPPQSAVILNRDFQQANNNEGHSLGSTSNSTQQTSKAATGLSSQSRSDKQPRKPSNNTSSSDQHKHRNPKPTINKNKAKKVTDQSLQAKNETTILSNVRGNRTSDGPLALADTNMNKIANQTFSSINSRQNQRNKTQENFSFHSDHLVPTLPTTIELTRSTSVGPISRTTHLQPSTTSAGLTDHRAASNVDYTTTSSSPQKSTPPPRVLTTELSMRPSSVLATPNVSNQNRSAGSLIFNIPTPDRPSEIQTSLFGGSNNKPGTSNFSNQWRPISNISGTINSTFDELRPSNRASTRKQDISFIVGTERIPPTLNAPSNQGSQSPFAMSTAILENQLKPIGNRGISQTASRRLNKLSNTYQVVSLGNSGSTNEFESHRTSRMRQNGNLGGLFSSQMSSTSTISSLNLDPSTRIVDDFMITTDRMDDNTRGATLLPPLVISGLQSIDPINKMRTLEAVDIQPKRTRGPFAFETLKSGSSISPLLALSDLGESSSIRPERSPDKLQGADQKLLVRKKLFIGNGDEEELSSSSLTSSQPELSGSEVGNGSDQFGNRRSLGQLRVQNSHPPLLLVNQSHRCPYYGCKAKGSLRFTCLNYTQICDDFIDCHDESDELDCVSLLKFDSKTNKLSFSNGGGIIYLNRKGSLAPMCIDYFGEIDNQRFGSSNIDGGNNQLESVKKQQELVRQINTIGQYACSLQSFARLVSVKINHNSLVDDMNFIKNSKLFHRLSILGDKDKHDKR